MSGWGRRVVRVSRRSEKRRRRGRKMFLFYMQSQSLVLIVLYFFVVMYVKCITQPRRRPVGRQPLLVSGAGVERRRSRRGPAAISPFSTFPPTHSSNHFLQEQDRCVTNRCMFGIHKKLDDDRRFVGKTNIKQSVKNGNLVSPYRKKRREWGGGKGGGGGKGKIASCHQIIFIYFNLYFLILCMLSSFCHVTGPAGEELYEEGHVRY